VLTFRQGAARVRAEAAAMAAHLFERTIPAEMEDRLRDLMREAEPHLSHEAGGERPGTLGQPRQGMQPSVAEALGVDTSRPATEKEVASVFLGRKADGTDLPGHRREVSYIDLCFSADKSVSVAWAFAETDAEKAAILSQTDESRLTARQPACRPPTTGTIRLA